MYRVGNDSGRNEESAVGFELEAEEDSRVFAFALVCLDNEHEAEAFLQEGRCI